MSIKIISCGCVSTNPGWIDETLVNNNIKMKEKLSYISRREWKTNKLFFFSVIQKNKVQKKKKLNTKLKIQQTRHFCQPPDEISKSTEQKKIKAHNRRTIVLKK